VRNICFFVRDYLPISLNSHALVVVEMSNRGVDAFKHNDYGDKIIIERRISESGSTTILKDSRGKYFRPQLFYTECLIDNIFSLSSKIIVKIIFLDLVAEYYKDFVSSSRLGYGLCSSSSSGVIIATAVSRYSLTNCGSTLYITGKKISGKREELQELVEHFNVRRSIVTTYVFLIDIRVHDHCIWYMATDRRVAFIRDGGRYM
jgi:hypothetical protein